MTHDNTEIPSQLTLPPESPAREILSIPVDLQIRTVVILEDNHEDRQSLQHLLSGAGFMVVAANTKESCLEWAREGWRSFVLDINLGEGRENEGLQTLEALKGEFPGCFCALVTDHFDTGYVKARAESLRADYWSRKSPDELRKLVQLLLTERKRHEFHNLTGPAVIDLQSAAGRVTELLLSNENGSAEQALIELEPSLQHLFAVVNCESKSRGMVWGALLNSIQREPGKGLTASRWDQWMRVMRHLIDTSTDPMSDDEALGQIEALGEAEFWTEPLGYESISEIFFHEP